MQSEIDVDRIGGKYSVLKKIGRIGKICTVQMTQVGMIIKHVLEETEVQRVINHDQHY